MPAEAWDEERGKVMWENSAEGEYTKKMKKGHGKESKMGQEVRIAKREYGSWCETGSWRICGDGEDGGKIHWEYVFDWDAEGNLWKKRHYGYYHKARVFLFTPETPRFLFLFSPRGL